MKQTIPRPLLWGREMIDFWSGKFLDKVYFLSTDTCGMVSANIFENIFLFLSCLFAVSHISKIMSGTDKEKASFTCIHYLSVSRDRKH